MKRWEIYLDIIMELLVILAGAWLFDLCITADIGIFMAVCGRMDYFHGGTSSD